MSNGLGLTIPISLTSQLKKHGTEQLEHQPYRGRGRQQVEANDGWKQHEDEDKNGSNCSSHGRNSSSAMLFNGRNNQDTIDDEDRMIMPFALPESSLKDNTDERLSCDSENDCDGSEEGDNTNRSHDNGDDSDDSDSDQVSLSPPPSMPILAVDLEQLCGYKPSDNEDIKRLTDDLYETLLGSMQHDLPQELSEDDQGQEKESGNSGDINYVRFTERSTELFESGIAYHSDTTSSQVSQHQPATAIIPYPEFLPIIRPLIQQNQDQDQESQTSLMATSKIWKEIIHPHSIPVVQRLLVLLSKCSRSLLWKYEMSTELRRLAKAEQRYNTDRVRSKLLHVWRNETRPAELAKLYDVRKTFEHKLDMSREKYDKVMKDKEERVQCELRRRMEKGIGMGGVSGLDWDGKETFAFGTDDKDISDSLIPDMDNDDLSEDNDSNDMAGYEHDDDFSGSESSQCNDDSSHGETVENKLQDPSTIIVPKQPISTFERKKRRVAAASKRMRRKLEAQKENARLLEIRQRIKSAHEEEEHMREICSTTEEKLALAVVTNLEKKLEKVDALLETLQEEEWKDIEEGVMTNEGISDGDDAFISEQYTDESDTQLLDQILAMILGGFPPLGKPVQAHFAKLKMEHQEIKSTWKSYFGRLPPSFIESTADKSFDATNKNLAIEGTRDEDIFIEKLDSSIILQDSSGLQRQHTEVLNNSVGRSVPDDWENIDDWSDVVLPKIETTEDAPKNHTKTFKQKLDSSVKVPNGNSTCTTKVGLRPGGAVKL